MPKCVKCENFLPPQFSIVIAEETETEPAAHRCVWCEKEIEYLTLKDGRKYTREDCIKDYELFMKKLAEKKNIADQLIKGKVDTEIKKSFPKED